MAAAATNGWKGVQEALIITSLHACVVVAQCIRGAVSVQTHRMHAYCMFELHGHCMKFCTGSRLGLVGHGGRASKMR
jgi:hypothetical protein